MMIVDIHFQNRPDGGLRAWSEAVPGLVLSSKDRAGVVADIYPAVATIIEHQRQHVPPLRFRFFNHA